MCYPREGEERKKENLKQAEFLSGFTKEDKLKPCITFVLYYGDDWDGSVDLHGLLDFTGIPPEIKELVGNYKINLMNVKKLESVDAFRTDLKQILNFIKYSKDVTIQTTLIRIHKTCQQAVSRCFATYCFIHVDGVVLIVLFCYVSSFASKLATCTHSK